MVDLNKLSQFNINDIDTEKILGVLKEHQNTLIKVVLVIGSLVLLAGMFNDHRMKEQALRAQITQAQEKIDALKLRDASFGDLTKYQASLPQKINEFGLIGLISRYAKLNHIAIPSLSPSQSRDMGLYDEMDISFQAQSDNFKDMVLFLRQIENSKPPLRIDAWSNGKADNGEIIFNVNISAVIIHS